MQRRHCEKFRSVSKQCSNHCGGHREISPSLYFTLGLPSAPRCRPPLLIFLIWPLYQSAIYYWPTGNYPEYVPDHFWNLIKFNFCDALFTQFHVNPHITTELSWQTDRQTDRKTGMNTQPPPKVAETTKSLKHYRVRELGALVGHSVDVTAAPGS